MYAGSLHPVERLDLSQRINGEPPPLYTLEQFPSSDANALLRKGGKTNKHKSGPLKYRYSVSINAL